MGLPRYGLDDLEGLVLYEYGRALNRRYVGGELAPYSTVEHLDAVREAARDAAWWVTEPQAVNDHLADLLHRRRPWYHRLIWRERCSFCANDAAAILEALR